jgi:hypothetical protein
MTKSKNVLNQRQFKNGTAPVQPADEFDRTYRREPNPPSNNKKRQSVALGKMSQARPGLAGMQDFKRKNK